MESRAVWLDDLVIYQVQPRSFMDSNNDGVGDIPGLISKLAYIKSLGVNCIYLNPVTKANKPAPGYAYTRDQFNGYECVGLKEVDPELGALADFSALVNSAHRHGLRIIIDFITIALSRKHPFFQDVLSNPLSKYCEYFLITDSPLPGDWLNYGGTAWNPLPNGQYYYSLQS